MKYTKEDLAFLKSRRKEQHRSTEMMAGRLCVISGATSGVGLEAARRLAKGGADLVLVCRNKAKGEAVKAELLKSHGTKADLVMAPCTTVYDGVGDLLAALRGRGLRVGIVSSKYRRRIETVLGRDGLLGYVHTIVGGEDDVALKPDPEGLQEVMRRLATEPCATLYVGDSIVDAQTAARAGTPFVAVLTGTTPAEAFAQYPSLAIVPRVGDVLPLVTGRDGAGGAGA